MSRQLRLEQFGGAALMPNLMASYQFDLDRWRKAIEPVPLGQFSMAFDQAKQFDALYKANLGGIFDGYERVIGQAVTGWLSSITEQLDGLVGVQRLNLGWLGESLQTAEWLREQMSAPAYLGALQAHWDGQSALRSVLSDNNSAISRMIADMERMSRWHVDVMEPSRIALATSALGVTRSYEALFTDRSAALVKQLTDTLPTTDWMRNELALPTMTTSWVLRTAHHVVAPAAGEQEDITYGSYRYGIGADEQASEPVDEHTTLHATQTIEFEVSWRVRASAFDPVFEGLGPKFLRMWQGAWVVLFSASPDRCSQATSSVREILSQVLHMFAPDDSFTTEEKHQYGHEGKVTRKMRLRRALGEDQGVAVSWVDSLVDFVGESNRALSAEVHNHEDEPRFTPDAVAGILMIIGGAVQFIVACRSS
jgi:hypothetical protein